MLVAMKAQKTKGVLGWADEVWNLRHEAAMRKFTEEERKYVAGAGKPGKRKRITRAMRNYLSAYEVALQILDREEKQKLVARLRELGCD